jgi:hypothetical protein
VHALPGADDDPVHRRTAAVVAPATVVVGYAALYLAGWWIVWDVPPPKRDGIEWGLLFLLTSPWSVMAGALGTAIVHAGAVINAVLLAVAAGRHAFRR